MGHLTATAVLTPTQQMTQQKTLVGPRLRGGRYKHPYMTEILVLSLPKGLPVDHRFQKLWAGSTHRFLFVLFELYNIRFLILSPAPQNLTKE